MQSLTEIMATVKNELGTILNGRIENAAKLIEAGAVTRLDDYNWTVKSQSALRPFDKLRMRQAQDETEGEYHVSFRMQWACTCKDYIGDGFYPAPQVEFMGSVGPVCKHIVAVGACWSLGEYPSPKQAPLYDLCIATRKRPFTTGSEDYLIVWYKKAGEAAVHPKGKKLTDSDIQKALGRYALVDTEALQSMVVRRYNLQGASA